MSKDQLFKIIPDIQIIQILLESFGLKDLEDSRKFTKEYMTEINTVQQIKELKDKLNDYYLPCKSKIYLQGINEKRAITILRQFIKVHNYSIYSKEKSVNGQKQTYYSLIYNNQTSLSPTKQEEKRKIVLTFDM
jgi:hypothetical protein